jgi:hypothetical protein
MPSYCRKDVIPLIPMTNETSTFRFVAQFLKQLHHPVPPTGLYDIFFVGMNAYGWRVADNGHFVFYNYVILT